MSYTESNVQQVHLKYAQVESTDKLPFLWYREVDTSSDCALGGESKGKWTLTKEGCVYVIHTSNDDGEAPDESCADGEEDDGRMKFECKWAKVADNVVSFVSPYDSVHLSNAFSSASSDKENSFEITANTIIQDAGTVDASLRRDFFSDCEGLSSSDESNSSGDEGRHSKWAYNCSVNGSTEEEDDDDDDRFTLYGIRLQNGTYGTPTYMYVCSQAEKREWSDFIKEKVITLKDPTCSVAQEGVLELEDTCEWDLAFESYQELTDRSNTVELLHRAAISAMVTDKAKPMTDALNAQVQAKLRDDTVLSTSYAVSSTNLAKSTACAESLVAATTATSSSDPDSAFDVPYVLALSKYKIYVFLKEAPNSFVHKTDFHYLTIKTITVKYSKYVNNNNSSHVHTSTFFLKITFALRNGCTMRFQLASTVNLLHEMYKALKHIALPHLWPEVVVVAGLKSRSDYWSWEREQEEEEGGGEGEEETENDEGSAIRVIHIPPFEHSPQHTHPLPTTVEKIATKKDTKEDKKKNSKKKRKTKSSKKTLEDIPKEESKGEDEDERSVLDPVNVYTSGCCMEGVSPRYPIFSYIRAAIANGNRELDLTACFGLLPAPLHRPAKEAGEESGKKLAYGGALGFLRADTYFRGVSLAGAAPGDGLAVFSQVVGSNRTLTRAVLRGVDTDEKHFVQLCESLRCAAGFSRLCYLDVAGNPAKDSGAKALARWIEGLSHGLVGLNLAGCGISSRGFQALFAALRENPTASKTLRTLVLTGNKLGEAGCAALGSWVASLPEGQASLTKLCLGKCKAALSSLQPLGRLNLTHFDISDTQVTLKVSPNSSPAVAAALAIFRNTTGPATLGMNRCVFADRPFFEAFVASFFASGPGKQVEADEIQVKATLPALVPDLLIHPSECRSGHCLVRLALAGVPLTPRDLMTVAAGLAGGGTIKSLDISSPHKETLAEHTPEDWAMAIACMAGSVETLTDINISDGYGQDIVARVLEDHSSKLAGLRCLDISGNTLCDKSADAVTSFVRTSEKLNRLACDDNGLTITTFKPLAIAVNENKSNTIFSLEFKNDFAAELQRAKESKEKVCACNDVWKAITSTLRSNYAKVVATEKCIPREVALFAPRLPYLENSGFTPDEDIVQNPPPKALLQ